MGFLVFLCVCMWEGQWSYHENFMDSSGLPINGSQSFPAHVSTLKIPNPFTALTHAPSHPFNIPKILCKTRRTDKRDERESREQQPDTGTAVGHTQLSGQVRQPC